MTPLVSPPPPADPSLDAQRAWAAELVERARADGLELVGPDGLLADVAKLVLEAGLEVEMDVHLGYPKRQVCPLDRVYPVNGGQVSGHHGKKLGIRCLLDSLVQRDAHAPARKSGLSLIAAPEAIRSASRDASVMMVSAGLADPWVGHTEPSEMNRLGTVQAR